MSRKNCRLPSTYSHPPSGDIQELEAPEATNGCAGMCFHASMSQYRGSTTPSCTCLILLDIPYIHDAAGHSGISRSRHSRLGHRLPRMRTSHECGSQVFREYQAERPRYCGIMETCATRSGSTTIMKGSHAWTETGGTKSGPSSGVLASALVGNRPSTRSSGMPARHAPSDE